MVPVTAYYRNAGYGLAIKKKTGGLESETIMLLAVLASAYPNEAAIKETFYLDYVKEFIREKIGGVEAIGYITGCIPDSPNMAMHNGNKLSGLYESVKIGGVATEYALFNDGGFNVYALSQVSDIKIAAVNHIKADYFFRSSFYSASTTRGVEARAGNLGPWTEFIFTENTLAANFSEELSNIIYPFFPHPSVIEMRPFIVNEEGKKYGQTILVPSSPAIETLDALRRNVACDPSGQQVVSFWMTTENIDKLALLTETSQILDAYAFIDDELSTPLADGYYAGLRPNRTLVLSGGQFVQAIYCPFVPTARVNVQAAVHQTNVYVSAYKIEPFGAALNISGNIIAKNNLGNIVGTIPITVAINENDDTGSNLLVHSLDYPEQLSYEFGVLTDTNGYVDSSEIQGFAAFEEEI